MENIHEEIKATQNVDHLMQILQIAGVDMELYTQMLLAGKVDAFMLSDNPALTLETARAGAELMIELKDAAETSLSRGYEDSVWRHYFGDASVPGDVWELLHASWKGGFEKPFIKRPTIHELAQDNKLIRHSDGTFDVPLGVPVEPTNLIQDPSSALRLPMGEGTLKPLIVVTENQETWGDVLNNIYEASSMMEEVGGVLGIYPYGVDLMDGRQDEIDGWTSEIGSGGMPGIDLPGHSVVIIEYPEQLINHGLENVLANLAAMGHMRGKKQGVQLVVRITPKYLAELWSGQMDRQKNWKPNPQLSLFAPEKETRFDWIVGKIQDADTLSQIHDHVLNGPAIVEYLTKMPDEHLFNWLSGERYWAVRS